MALTLNACSQTPKDSYFTYFLIDRSGNLKNVDSFKETFSFVKRQNDNNKVDNTLIVAAITGKSSQARILGELLRPADTLMKNEMKLKKQRRDFEQSLGSIQDKLLLTMEDHPKSAILETLADVAESIAHHSGVSKKRLVIFSDMIQNSRALSFYHVNTSVSQDKLIALIKTKGLLPSFPNVDVYVYGTGGSVSEEKIRYIKQFWKSYFAATGSVLKAYSPTPAGY